MKPRPASRSPTSMAVVANSMAGSALVAPAPTKMRDGRSTEQVRREKTDLAPSIQPQRTRFFGLVNVVFQKFDQQYFHMLGREREGILVRPE
jgi:hypothetical protein